jgi:Uma2 family endonuclease
MMLYLDDDGASPRLAKLLRQKDAYLTIPSLSAYLLVEQESATVVVFRRSGQDIVREVYEGLSAIIPLPECAIELPLAEIYEAVEFVPEKEVEG